MDIDRRTLLKASLALPMAATIPSLFARAAWAAEPGDRVLVLLQLEGGNDGLNMIVPAAHDAYHRLRPGLRIPEDQVIDLKDGVGLAPSLKGLQPLWDDGALAVVQGVGYPEPNRSHFTSTDIWHSASLDPSRRNTGWIGRLLDKESRRDGAVPGLQLDPGPLSLALVGENTVVPSVRDARDFKVRGGDNTAERLEAVAGDATSRDTLGFLRESARQAYSLSDSLERALDADRGRAGYPGSPLAQRLWQIARMVESGLPTRIYAVKLSGFDTHSRQKDAHAQLLRYLGDAVGAFYADLKKHGLDKRVLLISYSEFGRRAKENRSLGTDHGAAAPVLVAGGAIQGGLHGAHPSLDDLQGGDLKHHTDFRQVYATILDRWLRADSQAILGAKFKGVPFV